MAGSGPWQGQQVKASEATKLATVTVTALSGGRFTIPEEQFVHPCVHGARATVPSLCFLVQHVHENTGVTTRIVFDLGLRRDLSRYSEPIRQHTETRKPITTTPDVVQSLKYAGLTPNDIDYVIYSHVHWDHIGNPDDFPKSMFVVGNGSLGLFRGDSSALRGGHSFFEQGLLDPARTIELQSPSMPIIKESCKDGTDTPINFTTSWRRLGHLPATLDVFQDGSLYIVDAPGHLPGHINLLARIDEQDENGNNKWVYLAGDACHDRRILRGDREIGEWNDIHGAVCCIHANRSKAEETLARIRLLEKDGVEVILAHDAEWVSEPCNVAKSFGLS